jgi:pantoate--beta-alanine ligase
LTADERVRAVAVPTALRDVAGRLAAGDAVAPSLQAGEAALRAAGLSPDYLSLVQAETLAPLDELCAPARLICAARLGKVRLLDNLAI